MIVFRFDSHVCTGCAGVREHAVGHVPLTGERSPEFMLRCTGCGDQDGPFAGFPQRDEAGNHLTLTKDSDNV